MDFGTSTTYIAFYLVVLAIAYHYFATRNKERMALIEIGANPDMFRSEEKYYILFVIGLVAIGVSLGIVLGFVLSAVIDIPNNSILFMCSMLLFGGISLLVSFFQILKWMKRNK